MNNFHRFQNFRHKKPWSNTKAESFRLNAERRPRRNSRLNGKPSSRTLIICFRKFDWKSNTCHSFLEFGAKSGQNFIKHFRKKCKIQHKNYKTQKFIFPSRKNVDDFWLTFWDLSGAKVCKSCRSRHQLSNEYLLAKIGVDTAENEPLKVWRKIQFIFHSPP